MVTEYLPSAVLWIKIYRGVYGFMDPHRNCGEQSQHS